MTQEYKYIGKVTLDYTFYGGQDLYTDGRIEDDLLEVVKDGKEEEALHSSNQWPILYHLSDIRENLLEWYPFSSDASVLEIGSGCGALTGLLSRKVKEVTCIELSEKRSLINAYRNRECGNVRILIGNFQEIEITKRYDYITLIGVWEYAGLYVNSESPYQEMLQRVKNYLKEDGKIIIAIENKTGLKYWNGAPEDHTGNLYSGLNDYIDSKDVRTFSRQEIEKILYKAGISEYHFFYPMPDYKLPEVIYSDCMLPEPGTERNYGKDYSTHRIYNFYDDAVFDQICSDRMFSYFANSFLIIAGEAQGEACYERYGRLRKEKYRIGTEIFKKKERKYVRKKALNPSAEEHIHKMKENEENWKKCLPHICCGQGVLENKEYILPYIEGIDLDVLFYDYRNDAELFVERFRCYVKDFLQPQKSSMRPFTPSDRFHTVFGFEYPSNEMSLECTNVDLIFSNLKLTEDKKLYCFDYEWVFEFPVPYEYVLWRSASQLYIKYTIYLRNKFSKKDFLVKAGISEANLSVYEKMEACFHNYVYGKAEYLNNYRKTSVIQQLRFV